MEALHQVLDSGDQPVWHRQGTAPYYIDTSGRLRKLVVHESGGELTLRQSIELNVPRIGSGHGSTQYDVAPDGRILFLDQSVAPRAHEIRVIIGWQVP